MSLRMTVAWLWIVPPTHVGSGTSEKYLQTSSLQIQVPEADFGGIYKHRGKQSAEIHWGTIVIYNLMVEESFMRGNKIKQNCFLGEGPRAICEERDSRKEKKMENLKKENIKNIHVSIINQYLAGFLWQYFFLL